MLVRQLQLGRRVRPWMVAVSLAGGAVAGTGCPVVYYGPAPIEPPPQQEGCRTDDDCAAARGPGWYCDLPADAPADAWGACAQGEPPVVPVEPPPPGPIDVAPEYGPPPTADEEPADYYGPAPVYGAPQAGP
jgi:hypothetical protein